MLKSYSIIFFFLLLSACSPAGNENKKETRNKKIIEAYIDTVWNKKELDSLKVYFSSAFKRNINNIGVAYDNNELTANLNLLFNSFPDLHLNIEYLTAAKNKIFMNWSITGTNLGEFSDHPATGKKVRITGITEIEINDEGMIAYENIYYNELSLMQQLGYKLIVPNDDKLESKINQN